MTVRELQTLALVAEGKPYGVIAEHLHVSYKTIANTCTQLKAKLGVRTLPELMRIAIQQPAIDLGEVASDRYERSDRVQQGPQVASVTIPRPRLSRFVSSRHASRIN